LDVDRMLDEVSAEQFDEWLAFDRIEPDPLDRIREILKLGFSVLAAGHGARISPAEFDPVKPPEPAAVTPNQAAAAIGAAYGF
jgi:hypothetical protein